MLLALAGLELLAVCLRPLPSRRHPNFELLFLSGMASAHVPAMKELAVVMLHGGCKKVNPLRMQAGLLQCNSAYTTTEIGMRARSTCQDADMASMTIILALWREANHW